MEDKVLRVAMGLRIGAPLVQPDVCCHCGEEINVKEMHGLIYCRSQGRYPRYASLNAVVKRSLKSAKIPSQLESNEMLRSDSKPPIGIVQWKCS